MRFFFSSRLTPLQFQPKTSLVPLVPPSPSSTSLQSTLTKSTSDRAPLTRAMSSHSSPSVSGRIDATDAPVISLTKALIASAKRPDVLSLAQGIVHWAPPPAALQRVMEAMKNNEPGLHSYGQSNGDPKFVEALLEKISQKNGLTSGYAIQVTAGANQAFSNLTVALVDAADKTVLFTPYYFNHLMALQMCGGGAGVVFGKCHPDSLHVDLDWLERECLHTDRPPKLVVVVNPSNPTGVLLSKPELDRLADICKRAGSWLVLDNTYEDFVYDGREHYCPAGDHIIHVFSFSKAFGLMGYRLGYLAFPTGDGGALGRALLKAQDTIAICAPALSQRLGLESLRPDGLDYVEANIRALADNRAAVLDALRPLGRPGAGIAGGEGAIYLWAQLPPSCSEGTADVEVLTWLINRHGVCVIPGSSCGAPGFLRAAYGNLSPERTREAAGRLRAGLEELTEVGIEGVRRHLQEMGL